MNVNFLWSKGIVRELRLIRQELSRMADCWERELADQGTFMRPPKADKSGPEPDLMYTDESMDALREFEEMAGKRTKPEEE